MVTTNNLPWRRMFTAALLEKRKRQKQLNYPLIRKWINKLWSWWPGEVAHAYNPGTLGGRGCWITRSRDWDYPGQQGETPPLLKIQKISWAWWRVPVIPATQEAEAGELPEPRRRSLWWAKILPLHSSLGNNSETPSQKTKTHHNQPRVNTVLF